jgi:hypothetical protein
VGKASRPRAKPFRALVIWRRLATLREFHMRAGLVFLVLLLSACQTPCPAIDTGPTQATFHCQDGSTLNVTFTNAAPKSATIAQEGYPTITLPWRIYGAGFRYSDGASELSGRTTEVHWQRPGAAETVCRQVTAAPTGS